MRRISARVRPHTGYKHVTHLQLLVVLSVFTGLTGFAAIHANECESAPAEAEFVEQANLIAQKRSQRCASQSELQLPRGIASAIFSTHSSTSTAGSSTTTHSEHSSRNGGVGAPLRC